jgi:ABC-type oligopeptide transport system substrate-binding subunit
MKQQTGIRLIYLLLACLFFSFFLAACSPGNKVSSAATTEETIQAINNDHWTFSATSSNPQNNRARGGLTGINEVKYGKDTMIVYLPYFGSLYGGAEVLNTRGPLDFTSTNFEVIKEKKNDHWLITIKPKDHSPVQSLYFTLFETGNAQLNVTLTNRSPISYNGEVSPRK